MKFHTRDKFAKVGNRNERLRAADRRKVQREIDFHDIFEYPKGEYEVWDDSLWMSVQLMKGYYLPRNWFVSEWYLK